jgi:hypothetical protein
MELYYTRGDIDGITPLSDSQISRIVDYVSAFLPNDAEKFWTGAATIAGVALTFIALPAREALIYSSRGAWP